VALPTGRQSAAYDADPGLHVDRGQTPVELLLALGLSIAIGWYVDWGFVCARLLDGQQPIASSNYFNAFRNDLTLSIPFCRPSPFGCLVDRCLVCGRLLDGMRPIAFGAISNQDLPAAP